MDREYVQAEFEAFEERMEYVRHLAEATIDSHRTRFFGGGALCLADEFVALPYETFSNFTLADAIELNRRIHERYPKLHTATGKCGTTRTFLDHLIDRGRMPRNNDILDVFEQKKDTYHLAKVLTPDQRNYVQTQRFSSDPLLDLRDRSMFAILGAEGGFRSCIEYERLDRSAVVEAPPGVATVIVTGKKGRKRPVCLNSEQSALVVAYCRARDGYLRGVDAQYETAFFIQKRPHGLDANGRPCYRLSKDGCRAAYSRFARGSGGVLDGVNPYRLRSDVASRVYLMAQICNTPVEEAALILGHPLGVQFAHYNRNFDLNRELLTRNPASLAVYLKQRIREEEERFRANPDATESEACVAQLKWLLGRCRLFMVLNPSLQDMWTVTSSDSPTVEFAASAGTSGAAQTASTVTTGSVHAPVPSTSGWTEGGSTPDVATSSAGPQPQGGPLGGTEAQPTQATEDLQEPTQPAGQPPVHGSLVPPATSAAGSGCAAAPRACAPGEGAARKPRRPWRRGTSKAVRQQFLEHGAMGVVQLVAGLTVAGWFDGLDGVDKEAAVNNVRSLLHSLRHRGELELTNSGRAARWKPTDKLLACARLSAAA